MAQASETPSKVLVPRPISSRMTRLRGVALLRMLAVSVISTMNVLIPRPSSSVAPTRAVARGGGRPGRAGGDAPRGKPAPRLHESGGLGGHAVAQGDEQLILQL